MRVRRRVRVPMPVVPMVPVRIRIGRVAVALQNLRVRRRRRQHVVPLQVQLVTPVVLANLLLIVVGRSSTGSPRSWPKQVSSAERSPATSAAA